MLVNYLRRANGASDAVLRYGGELLPLDRALAHTPWLDGPLSLPIAAHANGAS